MGRFFRRKIFLIAAGLSLFFFAFFFYWFLLRAPTGTLFPKIIQIRKGMPLKKVSAILEQEGIISDGDFFIAIAAILGKKSGIKAGEYEFHHAMSLLGVLDTLVKGQVKRHLITIAEGYTLFQIAQLLNDQNIVEKEAFLQKATSPAFISTLGLSPPSPITLEGYLFPDTYHLIKNMDAAETIRIMVQRFKKAFGSDMESRAAELGISQRDVVTLASIIEKETSASGEKPLISAVFHNRLKGRIPLQSDPTVIYGIKGFNGNLTRADLMRPTPYNTYLKIGLPPTAISNPGKESLLAALYPAPVSYLYFVSKNDGSHHFSSDIEEHNRAVSKYQKYPARNNLTKQ
jgi:UPF0755 protein